MQRIKGSSIGWKYWTTAKGPKERSPRINQSLIDFKDILQAAESTCWKWEAAEAQTARPTLADYALRRADYSTAEPTDRSLCPIKRKNRSLWLLRAAPLQPQQLDETGAQHSPTYTLSCHWFISLEFSSSLCASAHFWINHTKPINRYVFHICVTELSSSLYFLSWFW